MRHSQVYVPLPTGIRMGWMMRAVQSGKHVLGEKPAACSAQECEATLPAPPIMMAMRKKLTLACCSCATVKALLDLAEQRGVQFMDG